MVYMAMLFLYVCKNLIELIKNDKIIFSFLGVKLWPPLNVNRINLW
jgi:hypothetical protein